MSINRYNARTKVPETGAPLVFAFHGTGGDENQFFDLAQQILPKAGIVSPRGDVSEMGAARFFRRKSEGLYDMEDLANRTKAMAAFIAAHNAQHPGAAVYGFGYSNGANILASVAMAQPDLFDRIALLHPLIPWTPDPAPNLMGRPVLITAGKGDEICPWPLTESLTHWFEAQGALVTTEIHDGGHEMRQGEVTALHRLLTAP
jgi:phospholipase/carboxylesterase